jgi:hypothetical protein
MDTLLRQQVLLDGLGKVAGGDLRPSQARGAMEGEGFGLDVLELLVAAEGRQRQGGRREGRRRPDPDLGFHWRRSRYDGCGFFLLGGFWRGISTYRWHKT